MMPALVGASSSSVDGFPPAEVRARRAGAELPRHRAAAFGRDDPSSTHAARRHPRPSDAGAGAHHRDAARGLRRRRLGLCFAAASARGARRASREGAAARRLLEELAELERAHVAGEVGPKTYERARRSSSTRSRAPCVGQPREGVEPRSAPVLLAGVWATCRQPWVRPAGASLLESSTGAGHPPSVPVRPTLASHMPIAIQVDRIAWLYEFSTAPTGSIDTATDLI